MDVTLTLTDDDAKLLGAVVDRLNAGRKADLYADVPDMIQRIITEYTEDWRRTFSTETATALADRVRSAPADKLAAIGRILSDVAIAADAEPVSVLR